MRAPAARPGVGVELDEVHHSQLPLAGLEKTVVRVVVEAGLVDRIVSSNGGGCEAAPGPGRHQRLPVLSMNGVRHPVVESEDPPVKVRPCSERRVSSLHSVYLPDGNVGPGPARAAGLGPVEVSEVKARLGVCLAGR